MQVYQLSIGAVCGLSWPSDRLVVQVLDDSTDPLIKVRRSYLRPLSGLTVQVVVPVVVPAW